MSNHWLIRIGDGKNFTNSSKYGIWGIKETKTKKFRENAKEGDILWFILGNSNGKIKALSIFKSCNKREIGPLINLSQTDEELGWKKTYIDDEWNYEIKYTDLYDISSLELLTNIEFHNSICNYNDSDSCLIDIIHEYNKIIKYTKIIKIF